MRTHGAVLTDAPGAYEVMELELDEPRQGELLIRMVAAGLCHSDDHLAVGDVPLAISPLCGGHEGAGTVERTGPSTPGFEPGDHVVFSFVPVCGRCRWCASGMQNLCDLGAAGMTGARPEDPTSFRFHTLDGADVGQFCGVSAFATRTVINVASAIKVDADLPLDKICLLGCGVGTGWGSAVNSAQVRPGDTVIVMGVGGIGINAVQGAAAAGASNILAVDPVKMKRDKALEFGATHAVSDIAEADELAKQFTNGQGADSAIVAVGVLEGKHVGQAFAAIGKGGTVVVTGLGDINEVGLPVPIGELTLFQKRIQGALFGGANPTADIPRQIQMYRDGKLKLDGLVTTTYTLDQVAQGYEDLHAGKNIRGVIMFD